MANSGILLVDDDDVDTEAVVRAIKRHGLPQQVVVANDGNEALNILHGSHQSKHIPQPIIILLDLNMPGMSGIEFLQSLRANPKTASTVVFVLTTSGTDHDKQAAYNKNIAGYLEKGAMGKRYEKLSELLEKYHNTVTLPTH